MSFLDIFSKKKEQSKPNEAPEHWVKCGSCQSLMYFKEVKNQFEVCPKCGFHMRVDGERRIQMLSDEGTFEEFDTQLAPTDPLKFVDKKSYKKRISEANAKTGRNSAAISGECKINGICVQIVCFDFNFMGGSLGSVEGEKIVRAVNRSLEKKQPLIIISASGGARMQESTFSLLQMSKTSAAIKKLSNAKIPYISVLTDPTMGGVSASFAWLGDIIIAEPGALVGFAGARVIKQTIGADLPNGFQRAEFVLEHGLIDMIVKRSKMKQTISDLLRYFSLEQNVVEDEEIRLIENIEETEEIIEVEEIENNEEEKAEEKEEATKEENKENQGEEEKKAFELKLRK